MDSRRIAAIVSLGLVGAVVVGLAVTAQNNSSAIPAQSSPATVVDDGGAVDETNAAISNQADEASADTVIDVDVPELPNRGPHPEFLEVQEWIQTDATSFDDFDGQVLAVQFWTFGCSNCQATFPHMRALYDRYGDQDFEIIGVHAPEFDFERDVDAVAAAADEHGLDWPIAIDNEKLNFRSWQERRFWPRIFLIDRDGNVRYDHVGEGAYDEIDAAVGALLADDT